MNVLQQCVGVPPAHQVGSKGSQPYCKLESLFLPFRDSGYQYILLVSLDKVGPVKLLHFQVF